ncbi:hypothetical protein, partial [Shigella sonnei]|uniref:hypothetical protein n=1 Tax=Shigella sonnei TaxID=624 RepID=UPI001C0A78EB
KYEIRGFPIFLLVISFSFFLHKLSVFTSIMTPLFFSDWEGYILSMQYLFRMMLSVVFRRLANPGRLPNRVAGLSGAQIPKDVLSV